MAFLFYQNGERMLLHNLLLMLRKNDIIYCNENEEEEGGWMMRGHEYNSKLAFEYVVTKICVNSSGNLQCYVCKF